MLAPCLFLFTLSVCHYYLPKISLYIYSFHFLFIVMEFWLFQILSHNLFVVRFLHFFRLFIGHFSSMQTWYIKQYVVKQSVQPLFWKCDNNFYYYMTLYRKKHILTLKRKQTNKLTHWGKNERKINNNKWQVFFFA